MQRKNLSSTVFVRGTRWRSWLTHWATIRKVAGSIPDCVIWNLSLTSFLPHHGPWVDSASNRNEYVEVKAAGAWSWQPSCSGCLEILDPQSPATLRALPGLLQVLPYLYLWLYSSAVVNSVLLILTVHHAKWRFARFAIANNVGSYAVIFNSNLIAHFSGAINALVWGLQVRTL